MILGPNLVPGLVVYRADKIFISALFADSIVRNTIFLSLDDLDHKPSSKSKSKHNLVNLFRNPLFT